MKKIINHIFDFRFNTVKASARADKRKYLDELTASAAREQACRLFGIHHRDVRQNDDDDYFFAIRV